MWSSFSIHYINLSNSKEFLSEILSRTQRIAQRGMLYSWYYRISVWSQPVQPSGGQKWFLTGKKLHSWVFGSYFSTTSIGDCWLPKPPITSRTSLAPREKRESKVKSIPSQPKGHLQGNTQRNTEPSLVQQAASKSPFSSLLWSRHLTWLQAFGLPLSTVGKKREKPFQGARQ